MLKYNHTKKFANAARLGVAFSALAALGGGAAHAQAFNFNPTYSQITNPIKTASFPRGPLTQPGRFVIPQMFSVADGTNSLTFTATNGVPNSGFQSAVAAPSVAPQFSDANFGGTVGDILEDTTYVGGNGNVVTGPLLIQFQAPVNGFGFLAQDFNSDFETFTLNVFSDTNATILLGTFTYQTVDNTSTAGNAVFVGALSNLGLPLFRSATLSSSSFATAGGGQPNNGSNDFFFGPVQVRGPQPVPEASTFVSLGMGMLLFGSLALRKRSRNAAPTAA